MNGFFTVDCLSLKIVIFMQCLVQHMIKRALRYHLDPNKTTFIQEKFQASRLLTVKVRKKMFFEIQKEQSDEF